VVRSDDRHRAPTKAIACGLLAVLSLPLLFLAVPFPFAGADVALGLIGREGRWRGLAAAGIVLGAFVLALGAGAYTFEVLAM
jgi:hypothetical protein